MSNGYTDKVKRSLEAKIGCLQTTINNIIQDANYLHDQGIPSNVWTVVHNLGKYPSVTVIDTAGTDVLGEVEYININTVKIYFKNAFSGKAALN